MLTNRYYLLAGLLVIVIAIARFASRSEKIDAPTSEKIAQGSALLLAEKLGSGTDQNSLLQCEPRSGCRGFAKVSIPSIAWRILTWSSFGKDPAEEKIKQAYEQDLALYPSVAGDLSDDSARYSAHQFSSAFESTGDQRALAFFFQAVDNSWLWINSAGSSVYLSDPPMLSATLARSFFTAYRFLSDPEVVNSINISGLNRDAYAKSKDRFLVEGKKALAASKAKAQSERKFAWNPALSRSSCYILWAESAGYQATRGEEFRAEILKGFSPSPGGWSLAELSDFEVLHNVIPCAEALIENGNDGKTAATALLQTLLRYQYDAPKRPLCVGDGGFLSIIRPPLDPSARCRGGSKVVAENAWFTALLKRNPFHVEERLWKEKLY